MAKGNQEAGAATPVNFKTLLSTPAEEATRPVPPPIGSWEAVIKDFGYDESRKKKTPYVRFNWSLVAPGQDIDPNKLDGVKWQGKTLHQDFYITDDAIYRITQFFERLGVNTSGKTLQDLIQDSPGTPGLLTISHRASSDPDSDDVYPEIDGVAAI